MLGAHAQPLVPTHSAARALGGALWPSRFRYSARRSLPAGIRFLGSGTDQRSFARLSGTSRLTVLGGAIRGAKDSGISGAGLFHVTAQTVYASGNTCEPDVQGAAVVGSTDPLPGRYKVITGTALNVTGAQSGRNYAIIGAFAASTPP